MKLLLVLTLFFSCDFADDPISKMFRLSKTIVLHTKTITIDPAKAKLIHPIHDKLFEHLADISVITTKDSLTWLIKLKKKRFSISSKEFISSEDIYFSFNRNKALFQSFFGKQFLLLYKSYKEIDKRTCQFTFTEKIDFKKLASSPAFFIYSKAYSSFDIPVGSSSHKVVLKPDKNEYVIIPYIGFLHLQVDSIDTLYWLNSDINKITKRQVNYDLPKLNRFIIKD